MTKSSSDSSEEGGNTKTPPLAKFLLLLDGLWC